MRLAPNVTCEMLDAEVIASDLSLGAESPAGSMLRRLARAVIVQL